MKIEICLPIKNEELVLEDNLQAVISFIKQHKGFAQVSIVVVLNGSTDNSLSIVKRLANENKQLLRYLNLKDSGKGGAIKAGWKSSEADILAFMDIDLVVPLRFLDELLSPILDDSHDVVVGSRYLNDSKCRRAWFRKVLSKAYILLSQALLKHAYSDLQCGFKAISAKAYHDLDPHLENNKWFLDTELLIFAKLKMLRVKELPVYWVEVSSGIRKSKIKIIKDGYRFIVNTLALKKRIDKNKDSYLQV